VDGISTNTKVVAGVVVAALGLGALLYSINSGDDPDPVGCALTAGGVTAIATGLSHGHPNTQAILDLGGTALAAAACKSLVKSLV
jgi:threonine/homoserine efflux transporter RhtA